MSEFRCGELLDRRRATSIRCAVAMTGHQLSRKNPCSQPATGVVQRPSMPARKITDEQRYLICTCRERGLSFRQIALKLEARFGIKVSSGAVAWIALRGNADAPRCVGNRPVRGATYVRSGYQVRGYSAEEDRQLRRWLREDPPPRQTEMARRLGRTPNSISGRVMTLERHALRAEARARLGGKSTADAAGARPAPAAPAAPATATRPVELDFQQRAPESQRAPQAAGGGFGHADTRAAIQTGTLETAARGKAGR